jgi:CspA family cold shock protein
MERPAGGGYGGGERGGYGGQRGGFSRERGGPGGGGAGGAASGPAMTIEGKVKFFNNEKGFGFVTPDDGSKDVFVHVRALQRSGLAGLDPEQRVRLRARMGQKGPMAESVELI